ncbi:hypothetical protein ARMSODRAFT_614580 [Armillaria solidipes]|uniref:Uncharacterized protein n=1 Tax=Armillaria solidipes TaxID=1076256 RepID=A0A2H3BG93_9AGAR|nr:hypothetical protein ARMSODRAFT_614580 [Armillaria solidipes]
MKNALTYTSFHTPITLLSKKTRLLVPPHKRNLLFNTSCRSIQLPSSRTGTCEFLRSYNGKLLASDYHQTLVLVWYPVANASLDRAAPLLSPNRGGGTNKCRMFFHPSEPDASSHRNSLVTSGNRTSTYGVRTLPVHPLQKSRAKTRHILLWYGIIPWTINDRQFH